MPIPPAQDPHEPLPVVDDQDRPLGLAPRWRVHRDGLRHRAAHVLLFDSAGRVYLQQRSAAKDTHPGKWTSSASGHVDPGEEYHQTARRELREELGLDLEPASAGMLPASPATENEFTAVYYLVSDREPRPNPVEIAAGRFFTRAEALSLAADPAQGVPALASVLALGWAALDRGEPADQD
ncbi:MAG: NUDIX domain-containing protein [Desulfarculus sp.]|nr:NUDIX domain-containing protein [Desulfarculus sp.]